MSDTFKESLKKNLDRVREDAKNSKPADVKLAWDDEISEKDKARNSSKTKPADE